MSESKDHVKDSEATAADSSADTASSTTDAKAAATDAAEAKKTAAKEKAKAKSAAKAKEKKEKLDRKQRAEERERKRLKKASEPSPRWWAPVMVSLMLIGLIYIVVYYISGTQYPIPDIKHWNLAIGFGIVLVGFGMTTGWK